MFVLLNLFVVGGVLLIAYWWANQGVFSAILQLLCVIAAGTIALAFWEPLMYKVLLRGGPFDNFAWGISLLALFLIALAVLRVFMDKAIPSNARLPQWANLVFGFPIGACIGVLVMGIFIIATGMIQTAKAPFGYSPAGREARTGNVTKAGNRLWIPVDKLTSEFYSLMSVTSLSTHTPMRRVQPELWTQVSLCRDTYNKGRGMISLKPGEADVKKISYNPDDGTYAIEIHFKARARDFGTQLTLSRSQVRLIGLTRGTSKPVVVHPDSWTQPDGHFSYDDISHYATSESGQQSVDLTFFFPAREIGNGAQYLQIRNTRYRIDRIQDVSAGEINRLRGPGASSATAATPAATVVLGGSIDSVMRLSANPRPIRASRNATLGTLELLENKFYSGENTFRGSTGRPPKRLAIDGLYQPPGTRVVQLEITRTGPANIFGSISEQAGPGAELMLVDDKNRTYWPIGYIFLTSDSTKLKLDPINFLKTMDELPILSSNNTQTLKLLFVITENVTVTSFRYGNLTVGTSNLVVTPEV